MKLTPKQKVLRKYPKAYRWKWANSEFHGIEIDHPPTTLGVGESARAAWKNAAKRLK